MAIDPSIALGVRPVQIENPLAQFGQVLQLQQAQQQNKLAQMMMADRQREAEQNNTLSDLYRDSLGVDGNIDRTRLLSGAAAKGLGAKIPSLQKTFSEQDKATREAEKERMAAAREQMALIGQVAGAAKDQQSYAAGLQVLQQAGVDISNIPPEYNPQYVEQARNQALTVAQQIEQVWKQKGFDLEVQKAGEVERHNKATEAATIRAQNMLDRRAREANAQNGGQSKAPAGYRWSGDRLEAIPGGPADKQASATEGERKAATLLTRLTNSRQQLATALRENPDAVKPGLIASGLRSIGAEALANSAATSPERQRVEAAQLDILDAALTLGTGAAYTREQLEGYRKSYFPQIGDSQSTIRDKEARLKNVIEAAEIAAGRAAPQKSASGGVPDDVNALLLKYGGKK